MNVRDTQIPASGLKGLAQQPCIRQGVLHDTAVAIETKMDEVVVLSDDLPSRAGEIQSVRLLSPTQVVQLED